MSSDAMFERVRELTQWLVGIPSTTGSPGEAACARAPARRPGGVALGEYMFGRGALDMKSGVAAGVALLERFIAEAASQPGALALVITPDEEDGSRGMIDLKAACDVTQPPATWAYYNLLLLSRSPAEALQAVVREVETAFAVTVGHLRQQAASLAARAGQPPPQLPWRPQVLTYAELLAAARRRAPEATEGALAELAARCGRDPAVDARDYSLQATELLWPLAGLPAPAAIVGIASLYYPAVRVPAADPLGSRLLDACARAARTVGSQHGCRIDLSPYFWGISDMSFIGSGGGGRQYARPGRQDPR